MCMHPVYAPCVYRLRTRQVVKTENCLNPFIKPSWYIIIYVNVIYYSTFKKYNFKKSKLTLSLNIFEVVYIWQHAKLWPRTSLFGRTWTSLVETFSGILPRNPIERYFFAWCWRITRIGNGYWAKWLFVKWNHQDCF